MLQHCAHPGCRELVTSREKYCPDHAPRRKRRNSELKVKKHARQTEKTVFSARLP